MDFEIIKPLSIDLGRDSRKTGPRRESSTPPKVSVLSAEGEKGRRGKKGGGRKREKRIEGGSERVYRAIYRHD